MKNTTISPIPYVFRGERVLVTGTQWVIEETFDTWLRSALREAASLHSVLRTIAVDRK